MQFFKLLLLPWTLFFVAQAILVIGADTTSQAESISIRAAIPSRASTPGRQSGPNTPGRSTAADRMRASVYHPGPRRPSNENIRMFPLVSPMERTPSRRPVVRKPGQPIGPQPKPSAWSKLKKSVAKLGGCFVGDGVKCR